MIGEYREEHEYLDGFLSGKPSPFLTRNVALSVEDTHGRIRTLTAEDRPQTYQIEQQLTKRQCIICDNGLGQDQHRTLKNKDLCIVAAETYMHSVAAKAVRQVRKTVRFCRIGGIFFTPLGASSLAAWEHAHLQSDPGKISRHETINNMKKLHNYD